MEFELDTAIEILKRAPATLNAIVRDAPNELLTGNEGEWTWCADDVIGHLIHGEETDWIPRANIIIEYATSRPFDPYGRFAQFEKSKGKTANELPDTFEKLWKKNIKELERITPDKLQSRGTHPSLGEVTLSESLLAWVVHALDHIGQIVRVMSKQYT